MANGKTKTKAKLMEPINSLETNSSHQKKLFLNYHTSNRDNMDNLQHN